MSSRGRWPYRCRHRVVGNDGWECFICGRSMDAEWQAAWLETGAQSSSRPLPEDFGMEATEISYGSFGEGATEVEGGGGNDPEG